MKNEEKCVKQLLPSMRVEIFDSRKGRVKEEADRINVPADDDDWSDRQHEMVHVNLRLANIFDHQL